MNAMSIDIVALGFTIEELQERVIDRICDQMLSGVEYDPDSGDDYPVASSFKKAIDDRIKKQVADTINAIAERSVLPNVSAYIEGLVLQETNTWGEKRGEPVTFTEYLIQRAQAFMQEQVDHDGKAKAESNSSFWSAKQTRITHLIHQHLQYSIKSAMENALKVATSEIAKGIHETARIKLNEIASSLKVEVKS
jgi:hypothetical protein